MKSFFVKVLVAIAGLVAVSALARSVSYAVATRREAPLYGPREFGVMLVAAVMVMVLAFAASAWRATHGVDNP